MIPYLARQKFRFDVGQGLANVINMALLTISAAPHIGYWFKMPSWAVAVIVLPSGLFSIWLAGYLWEQSGGFREYQTQINNHNEVLTKLNENLDQKR